MNNISEIKTLAEIIGLPKEAYDAAIPVCEEIIKNHAEEYKKIETEIPEAEAIYALADNMNIDRDLSMLAVCLMLGASAHDLYIKKGISEEIYRSSMRDITVWTNTCMKMRGHVGLYEYGWIRHFLKAEIVRIHRLEFHIITFLHGKTWSKAGITLDGGTPENEGDHVINIHIPEDGPLNHDDVIESYRQAYRYFNCTGLAPFVCDSWLLFPGNYDFLPQNSNIRKFMDDFEIIESEKRRNCGDLWRVFGPCGSYDDLSKLPANTGLQRGMIEYLRTHDNVTGSGYGIFLFDGEKVVK